MGARSSPSGVSGKEFEPATSLPALIIEMAFTSPCTLPEAS
jgi:hypothetical protein